MPERGSTVSREFPQTEWETLHALGSYADTVREFQTAKNKLEAAEDYIDAINQGLPDGCVVVTFTSFSSFGRPDSQSGYNKIYRQDESGEYVIAGEICTEGTRMPFLGNRIIKTEDNELVVINDALKLGLSTKIEVIVADTINDPYQQPAKHSAHINRFEETLSYIQQVSLGGKVAYDCLYY